MKRTHIRFLRAAGDLRDLQTVCLNHWPLENGHLPAVQQAKKTSLLLKNGRERGRGLL